ncbi:MAG: hypothetical protein JST14_13650 [Bacteroidetes bacterium]|nr:hypothetical protein [Bacteroidota bacterium]MBS1975869.1 hypothetical protein [Bacteroidota bacterium]
MSRLIGRIVTADEVARLPGEIANEWFLLEVLSTDEKGRANKLRIAGHDKNKDLLRDHLLELEHGPDKRYIFFFSDPDRACELE